MKTINIFLFFGLILLTTDLSAQSFTNINAQFPRFYYSSNTAWGDYDSDGDLDLVMCGDTTNPYPYLTRLYRNDGNNQFTPVESSININSIGDFEWGDCDNDGDADLLYAMIAGVDYANSLVIFRNDGNGDFIPETIASFENAYEVGNIAWTDWDNDGDLDFVNFPRGYSFYITISLPPQFFRNDGNGSFQTTEIALPPLLFGQIEVGDLNSDGTTDIIATGADTAFVFLNQMNDEFTVIPLPADLEYYMGNIDLADYDNDGDLDAAVIGMLLDPYIPYTINILKNDGTGNFTKITIADFDLYDSDIDFGDYDNDGDPDLIFSGFTGWWGGNPSVPYVKTEFYRNDGNDTFTFEDFGITAYGFGNQEWGDYDNDGRIDLVITGYEPPAIYQSSGFAANTPPPAPENLQVTYDFENYCFVLSWDPATDAQTPSQGLSYNVRIGSYPGGDDVLAPMARPDGRRLIPETGNAGQNTFYKFFNPPFGQYCWSVQAIDGAFAGSEFSVESSFNSGILPVVTTLPAQNVGANSAILKGIIQTGQMQVESGFMVGNNNEWNAFPATPANIPWTSLDTISLTLSSLDTNTTYQFCAFAKISDEAKELVYVYGDTLDFTTGQNPGSITGDTVTDITFYSARLHGFYDPNGQESQLYFEMGTDTTFGYTFAASPFTSSGDEPVAFDKELTGIRANTLYYFRVKIVNGRSEIFGETKSFATQMAPDDNFTFLTDKTEKLIGVYDDISASGTPIAVENYDDCHSAPVLIGFPFTLGGATFSEFILNSNGFIKLGNVQPADSVQFYILPNFRTLGGIFPSPHFADVYLISPFNHDLQAGLYPPEFMVLTTGTEGSRKCIIQFKNLQEKVVPPNRQFENLEFQVVLYEGTNVVEFVYGNYQPTAEPTTYRTAAVGIKGADESDGQLITITKGSNAVWDNVSFNQGDYCDNCLAFNYGHAPRPLPEPGRTYRFYPRQANDAAMQEIYTLGKLPIPFGLPHTISAPVKNTGYDTLFNLPVQLEITGSNTFSDTYIIPSLKPDSTWLVIFEGFNPTVLGFNTISVTIPADGFNNDNGKNFVQEITTDRYSYCDTNMYSHRLGWINQGQGSVPGTFLCRFPMNGIKNIKALRIGLGTGDGQSIFARVLNAVGQPLETSDPVTIDANNSWSYHTFEFDMPPVVNDGFFYVGLVQSPSASDYYPLGYQIEYPRRRGAFYLQTECCDVTEVYDYDHRFVIEAILDTATCIPHFETQCTAGYSAYIRNVFTTEGVTNFSCINNICNENPDNYTLHSDKIVSAQKGTHFTIHLTENNNNLMYSIYADWDHDGMFYSPGELLYDTENWMQYNFFKKINIPMVAQMGNTRLRVVARERWFQAAQNPCGSFFDGETRDFILEVLPPDQMAITGSEVFQCDTLAPVGRGSENFPVIGIKLFVSGVLDTISVSGFKIQPTGCTDFANDVSNVKIWFTPYDSVLNTAMMYNRAVLFGSANDLVLNITGNQPLTYGTKYFWITFDVAENAAIGNYLDASCTQITFEGADDQSPVNPAPSGQHMINYCIPFFDSPEGYACILGFYTTGGSTNINNLNSFCSNNSQSYTYFPDQVLTVSQGSEFQYFIMNYDFEISFSMFIDWNSNGDFDDANEFIFDSYGSNINGNVTVPTNALPGTTRLRVISYADFFKSKSVLSAGCGEHITGECEDYNILITNSIPVVPENDTIKNRTVGPGLSECFNAVQTITVAGENSFFTAEPNSMVEFYAGYSVKLLEGTSLKNGSQVLARIVPGGPYCQRKAIVAGYDLITFQGNEMNDSATIGDDKIRIYPNPTGGLIYIELDDDMLQSDVKTEIYNLQAEKVLSFSSKGYKFYQADLSNQPRGLYIIRISTQGESFSLKAILR